MLRLFGHNILDMSPSTEAMSISSTPLACRSVRTDSQKLAPSFPER